MANAIGVNLLVRTADGHVLMQHRNISLAVRPREACSSASGAVDANDRNDKRYFHPILAAVLREAEEEIALEAEEVRNVIFLGAVREFLRGGSPDFFFSCDATKTRSEIEKGAQEENRAIDGWEMGKSP